MNTKSGSCIKDINKSISIPDVLCNQSEEYLHYLRNIFDIVTKNSNSIRAKTIKIFDRISLNISSLMEKFNKYHSKTKMYQEADLSFYSKQIEELSQNIEKIKLKPKPVEVYQLRKNFMRLNGIIEEFMNSK